MLRSSLVMAALSMTGLVACTSPSAAPTQTTAPTLTTAVAKPATAAAASPVPSPSALPAALPSPSPAAAAPSPSAVGATTASPSAAGPTATSVAAPEKVWIGATNGTGVYLRNSPHDGDRSTIVLTDGTQVTITGDQVEGDGKQWYPIVTANNDMGYVPVEYVVRTEPKEPPAPPTGEPK